MAVLNCNLHLHFLWFDVSAWANVFAWKIQRSLFEWHLFSHLMFCCFNSFVHWLFLVTELLSPTYYVLQCVCYTHQCVYMVILNGIGKFSVPQCVCSLRGSMAPWQHFLPSHSHSRIIYGISMNKTLWCGSFGNMNSRLRWQQTPECFFSDENDMSIPWLRLYLEYLQISCILVTS